MHEAANHPVRFSHFNARVMSRTFRRNACASTLILSMSGSSRFPNRNHTGGVHFHRVTHITQERWGAWDTRFITVAMGIRWGPSRLMSSSAPPPAEGRPFSAYA